MPELNQPYRSSTGVEEFFYGNIGEGTTAETLERVKFLQNINTEMAQEIVKAYGDNTTAEMAVSSGDIAVTGQFHKIPLQHKVKLLGWEEAENGLVATGSQDNPPYVGVIFAQTYEDGSREYVGLPKGIFTRPNLEKATKGESTEFSSEEISAQFQDREVDGFDKMQSVIFGYDPAGETDARDAIFQAVFGKPHPDAEEGTPSEPEGA